MAGRDWLDRLRPQERACGQGRHQHRQRGFEGEERAATHVGGKLWPKPARITIFPHRSFHHPRLIEHGMVDDGPPIGRIDEMNLPVLRLHRHGVGVIVRAFGKVTSIGITSIVVGGNGDGQRRALVHVVIEDQEQMAVLLFDEINGGIGIGELGIDAGAPSQSIVEGFGADEPAIGLSVVITPASAKCDQVLATDECGCGLNIAKARPDSIRFRPLVS